MKPKSKVLPFRAAGVNATLKTEKPAGVDLGALQADYVATGKALKGAETKLKNARAAHIAAGEKLKAASRAVLAEV